MAQTVLDKARAGATDLTQKAEEEGQASAEQDTGRDWTAARRRARAIRLAAQRSVYHDLRTSASRAIESDRRCADLLHHIAEAARLRLGQGAVVTVSARSVRATRNRMHVRWTVDEAVDDALSRLGPQVEELWR